MYEISLRLKSGEHFVLRIIDAGIMGAYQIYSQRGASNRSVTGNLNNLSIGCRIMPRWYGAIFMAPVSSVGYAITLDEEVAGTNGGTISSLFQGEGGLSKMGISTAYLSEKDFLSAPIFLM